jgi:hypothetical protein
LSTCVAGLFFDKGKVRDVFIFDCTPYIEGVPSKGDRFPRHQKQ